MVSHQPSAWLYRKPAQWSCCVSFPLLPMPSRMLLLELSFRCNILTQHSSRVKCCKESPVFNVNGWTQVLSIQWTLFYISYEVTCEFPVYQRPASMAIFDIIAK